MTRRPHEVWQSDVRQLTANGPRWNVRAMPNRSLNRRLPVLLLIGSLAGLAALVLVPGWAPFVQRFEHQTADWRTATFSDQLDDLHPRVAVVLISEATLQDYPYLLPPDRGLLANLVRALDAAGAKVIGLDFYFSRQTEPEKDAALVAALREVGAKVVLGALDERGRLTGRQREIQRSLIRDAGRPAGYINLRTEPDGIVRFRAGARSGSETPLSFAQRLAEEAGGGSAAVEDPIAWLKPPRSEKQAFLTLPAEALLAGTEANAEALRQGTLAKLSGKAVLIGGDFAYLDRHATPLSGKGGKARPGVFVHAQDVAQRLDGRVMHELDLATVRWVLLGVALAAAVLGWSFGVRHYNLVGWTAATAVLVAADVLVFSQLRTILPFSLMLGAWVLGATAGRSLRLMASGAQNEERLVS